LTATARRADLALQQRPDRGHQHQVQAPETADVRAGRLRAAASADLAQL